jgi:phage shock protein A
MSSFDRLGNLVKGTLKNSAEAVVGGLERDNAEAVFESAIDQGKARLEAQRSTLAGLVVQRDRTAARLQGSEAELQQVLDALTGAVDEGDDDTATVLLVRRDELSAQLETSSAQLLGLAAQVEEGKAALRAAEAAVVALGREKTTALAQQAAAEVALEVQEAASGLSENATARALDSVRESVGALERRAHPGYLDAEGNSIRGRAEALGRAAAEQDARDQLEALKRARKPGK